LNGRFEQQKGEPATQQYSNVPDAQGNAIPVKDPFFEEREEMSQYLRDLGRYLRRKGAMLWRKWEREADCWRRACPPPVEQIVAIEPALSEFSLYRSFNGGAE